MRTTRRGLAQSYGLPDDVRGMLTRRLTELAGPDAARAVRLRRHRAGQLERAGSEPQPCDVRGGQQCDGRAGAAFSDLMMQLFGVGSVGAGAAGRASGAGGSSPTGRVDAERLRVVAVARRAALALGLRLRASRRRRHWPLPTGLGGVVGDWTFGVPAILFFARSAGLAQAILTLLPRRPRLRLPRPRLPASSCIRRRRSTRRRTCRCACAASHAWPTSDDDEEARGAPPRSAPCSTGC